MPVDQYPMGRKRTAAQILINMRNLNDGCRCEFPNSAGTETIRFNNHRHQLHRVDLTKSFIQGVIAD